MRNKWNKKELLNLSFMLFVVLLIVVFVFTNFPTKTMGKAILQNQAQFTAPVAAWTFTGPQGLAFGIASDAEGNAYVAGFALETAGTSFYVAKISPEGRLIWESRTNQTATKTVLRTAFRSLQTVKFLLSEN